jgi:hypothetical protein
MNPSLEQLKTLLVAAQAGPFGGGAQLGKAQSAVSTAIANLEIDLGLELFDRSGRYPVLTEAGPASPGGRHTAGSERATAGHQASWPPVSSRA